MQGHSRSRISFLFLQFHLHFLTFFELLTETPTRQVTTRTRTSKRDETTCDGDKARRDNSRNTASHIFTSSSIFLQSINHTKSIDRLTNQVSHPIHTQTPFPSTSTTKHKGVARTIHEKYTQETEDTPTTVPYNTNPYRATDALRTKGAGTTKSSSSSSSGHVES